MWILMLTGEAFGFSASVTVQFYSVRLWLCRGQSPRGQGEWVHALQLSRLRGVTAEHCSTKLKNQEKKRNFFLLLIAEPHLICSLFPPL